MKINEIDLKLLEYLYHNNREPLTKIAKETKLTRKQVEYKINKFKEEGIIKKYLTLFNYGKLGYRTYSFLLIKLKKPSLKENFIKKIKNKNNIISWGDCFGKYDIYINSILKNEVELSSFLLSLGGDCASEISDVLVIKPYLTEFYPLKIFGSTNRKKLPLAFPQENKITLDKNEIKILELLEKDGQIKVIDIANKLNISAELVLYKLKKLYTNGVILGSRLHLDMKKLGYNYSGFFIHFKSMSKNIEEKLVEFSRDHKFVNALVLSIANPNCFVQIFHETEEELKNVINDLKELAKEELFEIELLLINEEDQINTLPFYRTIT